jgi:ferritin-like metal-binding protein YciE
MKTLKDFMVDQLSELYNAEFQLGKLVDLMAVESSNEGLRYSFSLSSKESQTQCRKLEKIFSILNLERNENRQSYVIEAICNEVQQFAETTNDPEVRDAGFIALLQKAKHYEIALYGTIRDYTNILDHIEAETLLTEILFEEKRSDRNFTEMARTGINQRASGTMTIPKRFPSSGKETNVLEKL